MTARVSFAARARGPAVAIGWVAAFAVAGAAAGYGFTLVPLRLVIDFDFDPRWALARSALPWAAGFALATWLVGRVLDHRSWEELGWRPRPGLPLALLGGTALAFGLLHLGNPGATAFSTVNVALAGVWLGAALFSPGAMPLAWGAHFGWNATLALGFAAPVSGYAFPLPALAYRPGAHAWIDGGAFGPEGGVVSTLVMLGGTAALVAWTGAGRGGRASQARQEAAS